MVEAHAAQGDGDEELDGSSRGWRWGCGNTTRLPWGKGAWMSSSLRHPVLGPLAVRPWYSLLRVWRPPAVRQPPTLWRPLPERHAELIACDGALAPAPSASSVLRDLFDGFLLMAAPKKRTSYTRKRVRQAGTQKIRGPFLQDHMRMCPVCERMRVPHRICDREDCQTYFKNRWF